MKARQLIEGSTFDPEQLKVIYRAFDDAWAQIAPKVSPQPNAVEVARYQLANVIINLARSDIRSADQLKTHALKAMFANPTVL